MTIKEIGEELKSILQGKTIDAILPPFIYVIVNGFFGLGLPVTISVLVLSYIYGVWRLKKLGGPGIEEYRKKSPRPWKGQMKGF